MQLLSLKSGVCDDRIRKRQYDLASSIQMLSGIDLLSGLTSRSTIPSMVVDVSLYISVVRDTEVLIFTSTVLGVLTAFLQGYVRRFPDKNKSLAVCRKQSCYRSGNHNRWAVFPSI